MSPEAKLTYVAKVEPMWVNFSVSQNQMAQRQSAIKAGQLVVPANVTPERRRLLEADHFSLQARHQLLIVVDIAISEG